MVYKRCQIRYTEDKVGVVFVSRNVNFRNKSWVADTVRKWVIDRAESYIGKYDINDISPTADRRKQG